MRYNNYHKHDHKGNPWMVDVIVKEEEYCKRAVELGHTTVFTTNHGIAGDIFTWMECAKSHNLKMIYGIEAYYVKNRFDKDRSNRHIIIIAKNNNGVMQINDIMSESHETGFYYRPRIDNELLFSLNPNDVIITSACVAGIWNDPELLMSLKKYFGKNFFLEVQSHEADFQKNVNSQLLNFSKESGIKIIHGNDSHYIYPEESKWRNIFLKGNEVKYPEEDGMILDYPDSDQIFYRYEKQGILNKYQVEEALDNTLIFDDCSEITLINDDIKLPQISDNPTKELKDIINQEWKKERENIPKEKWPVYLDAIRDEVDTIEKTHMENYFLIDYKVAKDAQEKYDGRLTNTGRGSAPSFYTTKLLGLTDIDRLDSPITLFPHRFMSVERIINARSIPDIDLNTTDREPFIKATKDLLGDENCAWMIAWKPLQESSAFKTYCKGNGMKLSDYEYVTKDFDKYRDDPKWKRIIEDSSRFIGVVRSISESPCSMVLYYKPVRKELGLIRTKEKICCLLDGYYCDKYKYLKNDYLTVTVWAIIRDVCNYVGIPIPTIREFNKLLDDKIFDIYAKGLTCTINQADSNFATGLAMRYKPKSVSEMSAFVAIIRPGCASLLQDFIDRKPYTTNVKELDDLLVEGNHRMIYQELIMKYLIWLGIEPTGSYDIIKKIAKKKFKEPELAELKEKLLKGWIDRVGSEDGFIETWTVVEQAAKYSFNACISGDTIIQRVGAKGHWMPTIEEMYNIKNDIEYARSTGHIDLHHKYNRYGYGNAMSMYDDMRIRKNQIVDIYDSGVADIYRVTMSNGSFIDCTMNHKFPTPSGNKRLDELKVGDLLYVKDIIIKKEKITSIEYLKTDKVYDIEMKDPAHNFISESGLITSNSHSLSYAYDSLYGAYLKSHYPLEYYTVALNYYEGDKERTLRLTNELKYFGIVLKPAMFRYSQSKYAFIEAENAIYKGIASIKDLNAKMAEELYQLRDNEYSTFVDLLYDIKQKTTAKKNQINILINLDFFSEFGDANYLLNVYRLFLEFYKSIDISKEKLEKWSIPQEEIRRFSAKETEKTFTKVDAKKFLLSYSKKIRYFRRTLKEKIEAQNDYLGYIGIVDERYNKMVVVLSVDTKYSPRISVHSLRNGNELEFKIDKKTFNRNKLEKYDVIRIISDIPKPKLKYVDGNYEEIPGTEERWITKYEKIENL